jgi:hypothetical protein
MIYLLYYITHFEILALGATPSRPWTFDVSFHLDQAMG